MSKHFFGSFAVQNSGDHGIMVPSVGEVDTVGKHLAKHGEGGIVSDVA